MNQDEEGASAALSVHVVTPEKASEDEMCVVDESAASEKTPLVDAESQTTESASLENRLCQYAAGNQGKERMQELVTQFVPRQLPLLTAQKPMHLALCGVDVPGFPRNNQEALSAKETLAVLLMHRGASTIFVTTEGEPGILTCTLPPTMRLDKPRIAMLDDALSAHVQQVAQLSSEKKQKEAEAAA